jgi:hypothetical protein
MTLDLEDLAAALVLLKEALDRAFGPAPTVLVFSSERREKP